MSPFAQKDSRKSTLVGMLHFIIMEHFSVYEKGVRGGANVLRNYKSCRTLLLRKM